MAETSYVDPKALPADTTAQEVAQVEAYLKQGGTLTGEQLRQFKRAKRDVARMQRGEPTGTAQRLGTIAAQAPTRGMLAVAGLPADLANLYLDAANATFGAGARAIGIPISETPAEIPGGTQQLQQAYTQDLPKAIGLDPFIQPDTTAERLTDLGIQGAVSAATAGVSGAPVISTPAATVQRLGPAAAAGQEAVAGATSALTAGAAREAGAPLPVEIGAGVVGGAMGTRAGIGGMTQLLKDLPNILRSAPNMTMDRLRAIAQIGAQAQRMLFGGTPQEVVDRFVMQEFRNQGLDDVAQHITREVGRQGQIPGYQPTLGGATGTPGVLAMEQTRHPAMQGAIGELEGVQRPAGQEAVLGAMYDESQMTRPPGPLREAVAARDLPVEPQEVAATLAPRAQQAFTDLDASTQAQATPLQAQHHAARQEFELGIGDLRQRTELGKEDIIAGAEARSAALETQRQQQVADLRGASASRMASLRARTVAKTQRATAKVEERVQRLVSGQESPRAEDLSFTTGREIRQAAEDAYHDFDAQAAEWFAPFKDENLAYVAPAVHTRLAELFTDAETNQRTQRFPQQEVARFQRAITTSTEDRLLREAAPGTEPRPVGDIAQEEITFKNLMDFRTNVLQWQRANGPSKWSLAVVDTIHDAMGDMARETGRTSLHEQFRQATNDYRKGIAPFATFIGEDILQKSATGPRYEMQLPVGPNRQQQPRDVGYSIPMSNVATTVLRSGAPHEAIAQFTQLVGGRDNAMAALEEMLAHQFFVDMGGETVKVSSERLLQWKRDHLEQLSALNRAGMTKVTDTFATVQSAQARVDQVMARGQRLQEHLADVEQREAQRLASGETRVAAETATAGQELRAETRAAKRQLGAEARTETAEMIATRQARETAAGEQLKALDAARKVQERDLLTRYFVTDPAQATPETLTTVLAAKLGARQPKQFAANVRTMLDNVRGDIPAEAAVRRVVVEELWKRAGGEPERFKSLLRQQRDGLRAAEITPQATETLTEVADMLATQQRRAEPGTLAGMEQRLRAELFVGEAVHSEMKRVGSIVGGFAGGAYLGRAMYQPGPGGVARAGVGVMTGRSIGAPLLSKIMGKIGSIIGGGYNAHIARLVEEQIFRPDLQDWLRKIETTHAVTPVQRAKLHSYLVTLGLPTRAQEDPG